MGRVSITARGWTAFALAAGALLLAGGPLAGTPAAAPAERPPNIVLILADDLGYAELGCYGQTKIRTPHLDRMAAEGIRFTQFYSGAPVCAPSRCALMTGKHPGHMAIRNNSEVQPEGQKPLPAAERTIAEALHDRGYATGATGKWGLGFPGSEGDPNKQGFDLFFGYNCQRHAHNHYPSYLRRNQEKIPLEGNSDGLTGKQFSHDLMEAEALRFIREHRGGPFFLYMPFTIPHLALQVPEDSLAEYRGRWEDPPYTGGNGYLPHPAPRAAYAAMVTRLDRSVGRVLALLKELDLERETLVLFASDNGPVYDRLGGTDSAFFQSAGSFRGLKGSVYEGGIRVPLLARWPGRIPAGRTTDLAAAMWDLFPTLCEAAGVDAGKEIDGISLMPTLAGRESQRRHEFLYWEFPAYGGQQALRLGDWKGVRQGLMQGRSQTELYNLVEDPGEKKDLAAAHPELVARIDSLMRENRRPAPLFPFPALDRGPGQGPGARAGVGPPAERGNGQPWP